MVNISIQNTERKLKALRYWQIDELYDIERFNSLSDFLSKAWTFILYWNLERENLKLKKTHFFNPEITNFQRFILDEMKTFWRPHYLQKSIPYVGDELI